jgi:hypothetical protein
MQQHTAPGLYTSPSEASAALRFASRLSRSASSRSRSSAFTRSIRCTCARNRPRGLHARQHTQRELARGEPACIVTAEVYF